MTSTCEPNSNQTETDLSALIAARAYALYLQEGRPHGRALEHWLEAEKEILGRPSNKTLPVAPTSRPRNPAARTAARA